MLYTQLLFKRLFGHYSFHSYFDKLRNIYIGNGTIIKKGCRISGRGGKIEIGENCYLDYNVYISSHGGDITVGNHTSFNPNCIIYGHGGLKIGNDVRIAANTIIIPANHGFKNIDIKICDQSMTKKGIVIKDNIWIGAGVTILDGVTIGEGSIVGAGSVVTKDIPSYSIAAGVPSKVIKKRK